MLVLLWLLAAVDPSGDGGPAEVLNNLPADPARAWAVIIVVFVITVGPLLKASFDAKKTKAEEKKSESKGPSASVVIAGSVTPHIDASQQLLATVVGNLEERARQAEAKYDELDRRHVKLVGDAARLELRVEMLSMKVRELEGENHVLQGQLRGRP